MTASMHGSVPENVLTPTVEKFSGGSAKRGILSFGNPEVTNMVPAHLHAESRMLALPNLATLMSPKMIRI